jgi:NhaP-type Na+/H+ or K+/H+ antiporter
MILTGVFLALVFAYSLMSRRLERTAFTAPIVFTATGLVIALAMPSARDLELDSEALLLVAELGLVMTLFIDAAHIDRDVLKGNRNLPIRLLSTGMLLTIALGAIGALVILRKLSLWEACILAAILAPTDAGLGQLIVNSKQVPLRIRQALNVEAGLNDGLAVPFLLLFIAVAGETTDAVGIALTRYIVEQLGYGALIGIVIGWIGGCLLDAADRRQWMSHNLRQLGLVTLPLFCVLAAEAVEASMFIAAFIAGLAVQVGFADAGKHSAEFAEGWGQFFNFFVFFLFGLLVAPEMKNFNSAVILYAVLSLTLVRMVPVALALTGTGLSRSTVLFMGWFGPRGLASIVLGLVYLEHEATLPGEAEIRLTVMATVLLSIFAHGLSTLPGIASYARRVASLDARAPEHRVTA